MCQTNVMRELPHFKPVTPLQTKRWMHLALVHYPHRSTSPSLRRYFYLLQNAAEVINQARYRSFHRWISERCAARAVP